MSKWYSASFSFIHKTVYQIVFLFLLPKRIDSNLKLTTATMLITCFSNAVVPSFPWLCFYTLLCHFIVCIVDVSNLKSFVWRGRVDTNVATIQVISNENPLSAFHCPAAAAAKLLQLCPILCDPIDGSPPGSPIIVLATGKSKYRSVDTDIRELIFK